MNPFIETAAEANFNSHQDVALELHDLPKITLAEAPEWVREQWLLNTKAALASLAQRRDEVSRLLIDHEYSLNLRERSICRCGHKPPRDPERGWSQQEWHREHLIDAVLAALTGEDA